ncbi:endopeptidase La [Clostridium algidicarnis]|uniref:Lon protease n=2 Tax=Clostridium algidicarnis TaxID=37659 RepID=A0A2S6G0F7_9CLOT|nr:endopeptidase La [Clostridium algidicarnis]MBB6630749.1 endopeptidase La [Clostridium algidicarnis]MBU3220299.1 endopeptidase La [Clostridium algidicarnis]MBU3229082.1 endopeptidase La [Clostridium algidicarnis]MBU3252626.1 endopeptidase La [Clostridium algidicarnis]MCB2286783.1 endopeptidase La [Clostridium algidicarnis]
MKELDINKELPVVHIPNLVLFHGGEITVNLNKRFNEEYYNKIKEENFYAIALTLKSNKNEEAYGEDDLYKIGTLIRIKDRKKINDSYEYNIDVVERVKVEDFTVDGSYFRATYNLEPDIMDLDEKSNKEMLGYIKNLTAEISKNFRGSEAYVEYISKIDNITSIIASLVPYVNLSLEERQEFLEIRSLKKRSLRFLDLLIEHKESIEFQMEMASKFSEDINKNHRENMLRRQLEAIKEELNESDGVSGKKKKDYSELIENAKMPYDVKEVALDELRKLERQGPNSSEGSVIQNYLDLLTTLPWGESDVKDIDIKAARELLNQQHYGLEKVKNRIIQHLTVMKLKQNKQGSILLLVGPPGTGKTSLGKSIAEALQRKYVRISLGGVRDEAEIRGHRRTYIGAMPGRIIQGMKKAGEKNPVFILDEVDKLMSSANGDPASALLEVLDPEQNSTFSDHYLEVPYDLSDVLFIATANSLRDIPEALIDRMEVIDISSYTSYEKFHIGKNHLISSVLEENGLNEKQLQFEDDTLKTIIEKYTREAGVRGLKRQLSTVARVVSEKIVEDEVPLPYIIKEDMLFDILGHEVALYDRANKINAPGVVTGLAWTPVGGDILFIEGAMMPGDGKLILTGQLGDVMKESAKIAQSLVRSRLVFNQKGLEFNKYDLHIHVPSGSIPKDGPSAGVSLFTTIASLVTGHPVDPKLAMTGEISLRGAVLPIGGLKEKVLAAHRAGIKRILLPKDNKKDIEDIPKEVQNELEFILVETIEDVIKETIGIELPKSAFIEMVSRNKKEISA